MRWFGKLDIGPLQDDLATILERLKQELANCQDVVFREMSIGRNPSVPVAVVYTNGLADIRIINDFVKKTLLADFGEGFFGDQDPVQSAFQYLSNQMQSLGEVSVVTDWDVMLHTVLSGDMLLLIDGWNEAITGGTKDGNIRPVSEPTTEVVIRGPKDSFTESLDTNISLVRRRIKSPKLHIESMVLGKVTQTDVAILYIQGIVNEKLVEEVKQRLNRIDIDSVLETGHIEELIEDQSLTSFPTVFNTERPDVAAGNLLEGRIVIVVEGTPFVIIVPTILAQFFQSPEDYYQRFDISTALRILRYIAFIISLVGPSLYIALITFHQEMIPTTLLISIAAQREAVPFPAFIEALLMEGSFEVIREAGVRMPRAVGQAVSIVGALILGQAAVQAGIVSATMVIVVAATGIASYSMPKYSFANASRLIRFLFMVVAAAFGLFGLTLALIMLTAHLASLRSFGVPYLAPFGPFIPSDQKDAVLRLPIWSLLKRPRLINQTDMKRINENASPSPSKGKHRSEGDSNESK